jgi:hypothetical protein
MFPFGKIGTLPRCRDMFMTNGSGQTFSDSVCLLRKYFTFVLKFYVRKRLVVGAGGIQK